MDGSCPDQGGTAGSEKLRARARIRPSWCAQITARFRASSEPEPGMEPPTGTVHHSQSHAQSQRLTQPSFWNQEFLRTHIFLYANPFYLPSGIFFTGKSFVFASRNIFICKSLVKHSYRQTRVQGSVYQPAFAISVAKCMICYGHSQNHAKRLVKQRF